MEVTRIHIRARVRGPVALFASRADAGRQLVDFIGPRWDPDAVVFGLPRGGLPVGRTLADALACLLRPVAVRKLPIPSDPEMGFGAVTADGTVRLNERIVKVFGISPSDVRDIVARVRVEVERRASIYPGGWPLPPLKGKRVWLVDDGLATGASMLAAVEMLLARSPASLAVTVPCAPADSLRQVADAADQTWCLAAQEQGSFAVASFYRDFHDLDDHEVLEALAP